VKEDWRSLGTSRARLSIIRLRQYWYNNSEEAIDFLARAIAVNSVFPPSYPDDLRISTTVEELRRGLTALQFQDAVVDRACTRAPRPEWLGHGDIFNWGEKLVLIILACNGTIRLLKELQFHSTFTNFNFDNPCSPLGKYCNLPTIQTKELDDENDVYSDSLFSDVDAEISLVISLRKRVYMGGLGY